MEEEDLKDFLGGIIFQYVEKDSFYKYLRLTIIVCSYIFFRALYQNYLKARQIKHQLKLDEQEKLEKPEKEARARQEEIEKIESEANTFGWGKKTRRNVKLQQAVLDEQMNELRTRQQSAYDAAEDNDIEDLLED